MKIVLIGSGNVATHLGLALHKGGHHLSQVYSRKRSNAMHLAGQVGAVPLNELALVDKEADLYILSVSDDALPLVIDALPDDIKGIVVHTAGSVPMNALAKFGRYGVFYPFQTFSKEAQVDFGQLPILYEAVSMEIEDVLKELAGQLSSFVMAANSDQRGKLHVAAVFACNFVNHMYALADELLQKNGLPFDLLRPLIKETAAKVQQHSPDQAQTGPAVRQDRQIVQKHQDALEDEPEMAALYELLSQRIMNRYRPE